MCCCWTRADESRFDLACTCLTPFGSRPTSSFLSWAHAYCVAINSIIMNWVNRFEWCPAECERKRASVGGRIRRRGRRAGFDQSATLYDESQKGRRRHHETSLVAVCIHPRVDWISRKWKEGRRRRTDGRKIEGAASIVRARCGASV